MRKTGSSDDLQDREEGETRLQRAVDPRFDAAKAANTDPETGEMAIDILDLLGDRLGLELGLPAMPGGDDDDDEAVTPAAAPIAPVTDGAIVFGSQDDISFEEADETEDADEVEEIEDDLTAALEPEAPVAVEPRQPGVRSLADLLANAEVATDDWSELADEAPEIEASAETQSSDEDEGGFGLWDAPEDEAAASVDMDGDAWPDEMDADPDSELEMETERDAAAAVAVPEPHAARIMDEDADEDLSLDDLPPAVSEIIGPGPDAVDAESEASDPWDDADLDAEDGAETAEEADAFGEEWPFRTETPALEEYDPAEMTFEGTDAMTENSMPPEETPEAATAPARKGFFGRFKKASPEVGAQEPLAEPAEAAQQDYVEPQHYVEPQAHEELQAEETAQDEQAPAPRKSRKGLLLASTAVAACVIGAGAFVLGPQLAGETAVPPKVQRPAIVAAPVLSPNPVEVAVTVVETSPEVDLSAEVVEAANDPASGLYDPLIDPSMPESEMPVEIELSVDEAEVEPLIEAPAVVVELADAADASAAPQILLDPVLDDEDLTPSIDESAIALPEAPIKKAPADIEFAAGMDDPGNGGIDDLFIRDEAPSFTAPAIVAAPVVDLSKYVPLDQFEALLEKSQGLEADIEELREAIEARDDAMIERDQLLQGAISAAARAENLAMSQNEVLVQVYELGAKMDTAESLVVDLSKRLAEVEMTDPADREAVEKRMAELDRRVEGVARDVGLVARMAINGGGKIPSTRAAAAPTVPVMAEPVFDTGVSTVVAPNADPSKIPGDVKIGQTVPGYGAVLDIIPTSDGGRLVVMEHGSAVLD